MFGRRAQLLRELTGERFDDVVHLIRNAVKGSNDWKAFYGVASAAKAYARGDVEVHLHLMLNPCLDSAIGQEGAFSEIKDTNAIRRKIADIPDLCIRFQRHPALDCRSARKSSNLITVRRRGQNGDEAMLIGIVQLVKKNKAAVPTPIPSLVWLKRLDACPETAGDALEASPLLLLAGIESGVMPISNSVRNGFVQTDRKAGVERRGIRSQEGKLPCETVECGAKVVRNLPDYGTPLIGQGGRATLGAETIMASFSVMLGFDNTIGILFEEALCGMVQSYHLALCPLDLGSWPIEMMHDVYSEAISGRR